MRSEAPSAIGDKIELGQLVRDVAEVLGPPWRAVKWDVGDAMVLTRAGGSSDHEVAGALWLSIPTYGPARGRLTVSGLVPKTIAALHVMITVDPGRAAGEIAREITRRLLRRYFEEHARVLEQLGQNEYARAQMLAVARELAKELGQDVPKVERDVVTLYLRSKADGAVWADVRVHPGGLVDCFCSNLTGAQALEVLRAIR